MYIQARILTNLGGAGFNIIDAGNADSLKEQRDLFQSFVPFLYFVWAS